MIRKPLCRIFGAVLGAIVVAPALIMLLDRREPLDLISGYITPLDARGGDEVRVTWTAKEHRACDGQLIRVFIDSAKVAYPTVTEPTVYHRTFSDQRTFQKKMIVPRGMALGPAYYTARVERWCNPIQRYVWPIKSNGLLIPFNVIE